MDKAPEMFIIPNDFYIKKSEYNWDEEFLKMKLKDRQMRDRQRAGLNIHKSRKHKTYF